MDRADGLATLEGLKITGNAGTGIQVLNGDLLFKGMIEMEDGGAGLYLASTTGSEFINEGLIHSDIRLGDGDNTFTSEKDGASIVGDITAGSGSNTIAIHDFAGGMTFNNDTNAESHNSVTLTGGTVSDIDSKNGSLDLTLKDGVVVNGSLHANGDKTNELTLDHNDFLYDEVGKISGFNEINLKNESTLTATEELAGVEKLGIDAESRFVVKEVNGDYQFDAALWGTGTVDVNLGAAGTALHHFIFTNETAPDLLFSGTFNLQSGALTLNNAIYSANLQDAILNIEKDALLQINSGGAEQFNVTIGKLNINQGSLEFLDGDFTPLHVKEFSITAGSKIVVEDMDALTDLGTLEFNPAEEDFFSNYLHRTYLEADQFTGVGVELDFVNQAGEILPQVDIDAVRKLKTGDTEVGEAHYSELLFTADGIEGGEGSINLGYLLSALNAYENQTIGISNHAGGSELDALLTGKGGFTFDAHSEPIILTHSNNYTGDTIVNQGKVILGNDQALGGIDLEKQTGQLILNGGSVDLAGFTQDVDSVQSKVGTILDLAGGTLNIDNGRLPNMKYRESHLYGEIKGDGAITLDKGDVTLHNQNHDLNANIEIYYNSSLTLKDVQSAGSSTIYLGMLAELNLEGEGVFDNTVTGDEETTLNVNGGSEAAPLTLAGDNSGFSGTVSIADDVYAVAKGKNSVGTGTLNLNNSGTLGFAEFKDGDETAESGNTITGSGSLVVNDNQIKATGNHDDFTGTLTLNEATSVWNLEAYDHYQVNYDVIGNGELQFNLTDSSSQISLSDQFSGDFAGDLIIQTGHFDLNDAHLPKLKSTQLTLGSDAYSELSVDGDLRGLVLDGGTLYVQKNAKGDQLNTLSAGEIYLKDQSNIMIKDEDSIGLSGEMDGIDDRGSLLDQQTLAYGNRFIEGEVKEGGTAQLALVDEEGNALESTKRVEMEIQQGAGTADYDYKGLVLNDGIGFGYGLVSLTANADKTLTIDSVGSEEKDLHIELHGAGGFDFLSDKDGLTVSNDKNNYTGDTTFSGGKITAGADEVFGDKGALILENDAHLDMDTYVQHADSLTTSEKTVVDLNAGDIILSGTDGNGNDLNSVIDGDLKGGSESHLVVENGNLTVNTHNPDLETSTTFKDDATADLKYGDSLGKGTIDMEGENKLNIHGGGDLANTITGGADSELNILGGTPDDQVVITGDNSGFDGNLTIGDLGYASTNTMDGLGNGYLQNDGTLEFNDLGAVDFDNVFGGTGDFIVGDSQITVNQTPNDFSGMVDLDQESSQWIIGGDLTGDYTLDYGVQGNGSLVVDLGNKESEFTLGDKINPDEFTGTLDLNSGEMALNEDHYDRLSGADVVVREDGKLHVDEDGYLNELDLDGGTIHIHVNENESDRHNLLHVGELGAESGSHIILDDLDLLGKGDAIDNIDTNGSFFDQQSGGAGGEQIIKADEIKDGSEGAQLTLVDEDGNAIESINRVEKELDDGSGSAIYDYSGLVLDGGVNIDYGLVGLNAHEGESIIIEKGENDSTDSLNVELTGDGGFIINPNDQTIHLGNQNSNYTGGTDVNGGMVIADSDNAFGNTSELNLNDDAYYDLNGNDQTVGELNTDLDAIVDINEGNLTILNGGEVNGDLKGSGNLTVDSQDGGELTIHGPQEEYHGDTHVLEEGVVNLDDFAGLGDGGIENDGTINYLVDGDGELSNNFTGDSTGLVDLSGSGSVHLDGDNSGYDGEFYFGPDQEVIVNDSDALGNGGDVEIAGGGDGGLVIEDAEKPNSSFDNNFKGDGSITLDNSDVIFTGDNSELTGDLIIEDDSHLHTIDHGVPGGDIHNHGGWTAEVNPEIDVDFNGELSGEGDLHKVGDGNLNLNGDNSHFGGNTIVDEGELNIGDNAQFGNGSGDLIVNNDGSFNQGKESESHFDDIYVNDDGLLNLGENSTMNGNNVIVDDYGHLVLDQGAGLNADDVLVTDHGELSMDHNSYIDSNVTVDLDGSIGGYGTIHGDLNLKGHLDVGSRVDHIEPNTEMGEFVVDGNLIAEEGSVIHFGSDQTDADRLIIKGDATGQSGVWVDDIHHLELHELGDDVLYIPLVDIEGNNSLLLDHIGRTVGGVYEFELVQDEQGNWMLKNMKGNRPETGIYIAGLSAANKLFSHSLTDRNYLNEESRLWTFAHGSFEKFYDNSGLSRSSIDSFTMMIGGDILRTQLANKSFKLGLMGGYGYSSSKTTNRDTGLHAKGSGDGYSVGIYATLGDNFQEGLYLDGSLQYVYFKNTVKSAGLRDEISKSKGLVGSIEGGYTFAIADNVYLQPQVQFTWMGAKMNDLTDGSGTKIRGNKNNIETRLGVRLFADKTLASGGSIRPYMDLNYIHNSKPFAAEFDGVRVEQKGTRNLGEVKVGLEADVNDNLKVWGDVGFRKGSNSYRDTKISAGIRYEF